MSYQRLMNVGDLIAELRRLPVSATVLIPDRDGHWCGVDRLTTTSNDSSGGNLGISSVLFCRADTPKSQNEDAA